MYLLFSNGLILIEAEYYHHDLIKQGMSEQSFAGRPTETMTFWDDATKYTSFSNDESFVEEVAYCMVASWRSNQTPIE